MKKLVFISAFFLLSLVSRTHAQENVTLYFFWGNGCPHCAEEEKFLKVLQKDYPTLSVRKFEVWGNAKNRELFKQVGQKLNTDIKGVPFTVVGTNSVGGFYTSTTTGAEIQEYVAYCVQNGCVDMLADITPATPTPKPKLPARDPWQNAPKSLPKELNLPVIGAVNLTTLSLPIIAAIIGTLDGFNPCAMWILLFLISLLLNVQNKKRRWLLGLTFLVASGAVYFLFMVAWLNILMFIGFIGWVRTTIAVFALGAGAFSLHKFWRQQTGCTVENDEKRQKVFGQLKKLTAHSNLLVALFGIAALAFAVNLVELLCSAGFPAIFTQILALNQLPPAHYYLYILLYIAFFMADDIIVFVLAMKTLETVGISTKYAKYSRLLGGGLMVLIGALLIIKPELLMFNF